MASLQRHIGLVGVWLRADGSKAIDNLESTVRASAGETLYAMVYGNDYYWDERGRTDPLQLRVLFTEEPFREPNDTIETAQVITPGEIVDLR